MAKNHDDEQKRHDKVAYWLLKNSGIDSPDNQPEGENVTKDKMPWKNPLAYGWLKNAFLVILGIVLLNFVFGRLGGDASAIDIVARLGVIGMVYLLIFCFFRPSAFTFKTFFILEIVMFSMVMGAGLAGASGILVLLAVLFATFLIICLAYIRRNVDPGNMDKG